MTDAERQRFFDDLARVFLRSAVREYLREVEEQRRREENTCRRRLPRRAPNAKR